MSEICFKIIQEKRKKKKKGIDEKGDILENTQSLGDRYMGFHYTMFSTLW